MVRMIRSCVLRICRLSVVIGCLVVRAAGIEVISLNAVALEARLTSYNAPPKEMGMFDVAGKLDRNRVGTLVILGAQNVSPSIGHAHSDWTKMTPDVEQQTHGCMLPHEGH